MYGNINWDVLKKEAKECHGDFFNNERINRRYGNYAVSYRDGINEPYPRCTFPFIYLPELACGYAEENEKYLKGSGNSKRFCTVMEKKPKLVELVTLLENIKLSKEVK